MRHTSRTHRVNLEWLFDSSNLDPTKQIEHVNTPQQLADILTKGTFTGDRWTPLFDVVQFDVTQHICSQ